jgi:hypothetical protein
MATFAQAGFVLEAHAAAASQAPHLAEELASLHDFQCRTKLCEEKWGDEKPSGNMVGASRFKPAASWFRTLIPQIINSLALGTTAGSTPSSAVESHGPGLEEGLKNAVTEPPY